MIVNRELASSKGVLNKDKWETPHRIFSKLNREFNFTLDPCCELGKSKCIYFFTEKENGLTQDWSGQSVFVNPPYSRGNIDKWAKKCYEESLKPRTTVVALLPVSTSANWFHKWIVPYCQLRFVERRIRFEGGEFTAPFSSVIAIFNSYGIKSFEQ